MFKFHPLLPALWKKWVYIFCDYIEPIKHHQIGLGAGWHNPRIFWGDVIIMTPVCRVQVWDTLVLYILAFEKWPNRFSAWKYEENIEEKIANFHQSHWISLSWAMELKCIYSYFLKTHDFLQSILGILAANKHF